MAEHVPLRPCGVCSQPCPGGDCPRHPKRGGYRPGRGRPGGIPGSVWRRLRDRVVARDGGRCQYHDGPGTTGDHVVPTSKGGSNAETNLVAACSPCNTSKGDRTLSEWVSSGCAPARARELLQARQRAGLPV